MDANGGPDEAYGGAGRDKTEGGGHDDKLYGGDNADILTDPADKDYDMMRGGSGNDVLDAYDSNAGDTLVCGPGDNDTAYFDRGNFAGATQDTVSPSCENRVANEHPK